MSIDFNHQGVSTKRKWRIAAATLIAAMTVTGVSITTTPAHADSPYVVNSNGDQSDPNPGDGNCGAFGQCTLRAATQEANASVGADTINFNIASAPSLIRPEAPLPTITGQTAVNGYTQPGSSLNTLADSDNAVIKVVLSGNKAGTGAAGFDITASNSTVRGLQITGFDGPGILIRDQGSTATLGVNVEGNFIGTDKFHDRGNGGNGIDLRGGGRHIVGGDTLADRNVISGNEISGIDSTDSANNTIQGNYIGTDGSGMNTMTNDDLGNDFDGVTLQGSSSGNIVEGNVISDNDGGGILIEGPGASDNKILSNRVGTDRTGAQDLGNGGPGVSIGQGSSNKIGDGTADGSNTIAFNVGSGVSMSPEGLDTTKLNTISRNSIFSNAKGINLGFGAAPLPNDPKDTDSGANDQQNYPVLFSAKTSTTGTTISGKLNSSPDSFFSIEFFSNPKDTNEGKTYLGKKSVSTDANGDATFSFKTKTKLAAGLNVTTTATRLFFGPTNTSEFSLPKKVVADLKPPKVVSISPVNGAGNVAATASVIATFNEAVQPGTINSKTVTLKKVGSTASVAAKVTYDGVKKRAILNPNANLKAGTYMVVVGTGVRDLAGNVLDQDPKTKGNQTKAWKFTVKK